MLPKLSRGTLAGQVAERLIEYIGAQQLKAGDLLPSEISLAGSFGVSRPVIREALKSLEGRGVIEIVNGRGALIRSLDSDPLRLFFHHAMQTEQATIVELMEVRKGLEVQAAALAAQRRDAADLEALGQTLRTMREKIDNMEAYTQLDAEFHLRIASASHNAVLFLLIESIRGTLLNTISAGLASRGTGLNLQSIQNMHELLHQTLVDGDVEAAARAMSQHFNEAITAISHPRR